MHQPEEDHWHTDHFCGMANQNYWKYCIYRVKYCKCWLLKICVCMARGGWSPVPPCDLGISAGLCVVYRLRDSKIVCVGCILLLYIHTTFYPYLYYSNPTLSIPLLLAKYSVHTFSTRTTLYRYLYYTHHTVSISVSVSVSVSVSDIYGRTWDYTYDLNENDDMMNNNRVHHDIIW